MATPIKDRPVSATMLPENKVNYSVALLRRDEQERTHITRELKLVKHEYGIRDFTVLEVGCGLAQNLEIFRADNHVFGIDGLRSAVADARSRGLHVIQGDLETPLELE